jgi:type II secretory pathway component PulF
MPRFPWSEFAELNGLLARAAERGLELGPAIELVAGQARSDSGRAALEGVARALRDGVALPDALARYPDRFPDDYRALIAAGMAGGRLAEVFRQAQSHAVLRARIREKTTRVVVYLLGIAFLAQVVIAIMGVLGRHVAAWYTGFQDMFSWYFEFYGDDPGGDPLVRGMAWVGRYAPVLMGGLAGLMLLLTLAWMGVQRWKRLAWIADRTPVWGRVRKGRDLALFCTAMALRLRSGAALPDCLREAEGTVSTGRVRRGVRALARRVGEGESLSGALFYETRFPRTLAWAVSLAEGRGDVPAVFDTFARIYTSEMERNYEILLQVLTPLGVLFLGNVTLAAALLAMTPFLLAMRTITAL